MNLDSLTAISPIDGRYRDKCEALADWFSEYALIRYRVRVEIEYFLALSELKLGSLKDITPAQSESLRNIYRNFSVEDARKVKATEKVTNHDVKAVEYFIKDQFDVLGLSVQKEFVHFGLTSQDVNNTAIPLAFKECTENLILPMLYELKMELSAKAEDWRGIAMLARTHGQPASPTTLGKEVLVYVERLVSQLEQMAFIPMEGKFGGATGNFNAHHVAYPDIDWVSFANNFLHDKLGLKRQQYTTQIEHYDNLAATLDLFKRINTILIDLCRDAWSYISMDYFKQQIKAGEVGSSAMPHKVNPIDFENAEGNLGLANAMFEHLSAKLPVSRLQRDLTDSTVTRNLGVPIAHMVIAVASLKKGWGKLLLNREAIDRDLDNNCMVVAEAIQTVLRREGYPNPYEKLKELTRTNEKITMEKIHAFVDTLEVSDVLKAELKRISPFNYVGMVS